MKIFMFMVAVLALCIGLPLLINNLPQKAKPYQGSAVHSHNFNPFMITVQQLHKYAKGHDGKFPGSIDELVPDYIPSTKLLYYHDGKGPFKIVPANKWQYKPGLKLTDRESIILHSPFPDRWGRYYVGYPNGNAKLMNKDEFEAIGR